MAPTPNEILASDHESDDDLLAPSDDDKILPPAQDLDTGAMTPSVAPASKQSTPPKTASAEERRRHIEAAHKALLAPTQPSSAESTAGMLPPAPTTVPTALPAAEMLAPQPAADIWDVPVSDEDENAVHLVATKSKPKAPRKRAVTSPNFDSGSDFESPPKKPKKAVTSVKKAKRSKTMPLGGEGEDDEDDFEPEFGKKTKTRKHTTDEQDLIPREGSARGRALRESAQKVNYYIPPPPTDTSTLEVSPKQFSKTSGRPGLTADIQLSSSNRCSSKPFMVDLTSQVLPAQVRQEYDPVFLESPDNTPFEPFIGPVLADSPIVTQPQSTLPDSSLQQTMELPPLPASALDPKFIAPGTAPTQEILAHGSNPEPELESRLEQPRKPSAAATKKKRAQTDMGVYNPRNVVATSWRAAKGKGRPDLTDSYPADPSDDDFSIHPNGENPQSVAKARKQKEKKPAAKKSHANKRKKTQTIDLSDSEDDHTANTITVIPGGESTEGNANKTLSSKQASDTIEIPDATQAETTTEIETHSKVVNVDLDSESISPSRRNRRTKSRFVKPREDQPITDTFSVFPRLADAHTDDNADEKKNVDMSPAPSPPVALQKKTPAKRKRTQSAAVATEEAEVETEEDTALGQKKNAVTKRRKSTKNLKEKETTPLPESVDHSDEREACGEPNTKKAASKGTNYSGQATKKEDEAPPASQSAVTPDPEKPTGKQDDDQKYQKSRDSTTPVPSSVRATSEDKSSIRGSSRTPGHKQGSIHSPIRIPNRQRHRVGLSRTARIEPLLKIVKKN